MVNDLLNENDTALFFVCSLGVIQLIFEKSIHSKFSILKQIDRNSLYLHVNDA